MVTAKKNSPKASPTSARRKPVLIQSDGFRCMAFLGDDGRWRAYFNGDEIKGRVQVVEPDL